jgi:tetratricopeptide (TPR) repeat protein
MIRILLALIFALSFPTFPGLYAQAKSVDELDLEYGLPRLISEAEKKKALQKKRSKVLTQSVARKVTRIVEAFDEAGTAEDEKALILKSETYTKAEKEKESRIKDREIKTAVAKAQRELDDLKEKIDSLKSYDRSMVWYYQGYINLVYADDLPGARQNYLNLIQEEDATPQIKLGSYYTVSQLYLADEDFTNGIKYLLLWFQKSPEVTAQAYVLLGQAYFLLDEHKKAFSNLKRAKSITEEDGALFRENWYSLLIATMSELGLKEDQVPLYEEVLELFPKKKYFVNLAGLYNELERPLDYTALLKTAYTKQLLDKKSEFQSLSQSLLAAGNPYWAAEVMITGMTSVPGLQIVDQQCELSKVLDDRGNIKTNRQGEAVEEEVCLDVYGPAFVKPGSEAALDKDAKPVLEEDKQNLTILAEALRSARERTAAIDIFKKLVKITDDGEAYIAMGNLYYQEDDIAKAVEAIDKGLKKGKLKNPGYAQLTLGQAYFELGRFDDARKVFTKASQSKRDSVKKSARAWLKYTDAEQERVRNLQLRKESIS